MDAKDSLIEQFKRLGKAPFLFVGTGLSRRYLELDSWKDLLKRFCLCGNNFGYYYSSCQEDLAKVGGMLAKDFHNFWWKNEKYASSVKKFGDLAIDESSALKLEICNYIKNISEKNLYDSKYHEELSLFKKMKNIEGIITTNYDDFLEKMLPDYEVYIGQEDLLFSTSYGIGEIYKIHGSYKKPNSLVLTDTDYARFEEKNPYLIAKILSIFVEHPLVFLGYSLTDKNILSILEKIVFCLGRNNLSKLQDRIIFVEWIGNDTENKQEGYSKSQMNFEKFSLPITLVQCLDFSWIYESILTVERRLPAKILRDCKEHIYELIASNDPNGKLCVSINDNERLGECEVVIGIGAIEKFSRKGYFGLKPLDIFHDIVFKDGKYEDKMLLEALFPYWLKKNSLCYLPIFYYLQRSGIKSYENYKKNKLELEKVIKIPYTQYSSNPNCNRKKRRESITHKSINGIINDVGEDLAILHFGFLEKEEIELDALYIFLRDKYNSYIDSKDKKNSFRKLICLYDRLKYGFWLE